jgi:putative spermidine/putrescine transport system substrate-binding protein
LKIKLLILTILSTVLLSCGKEKTSDITLDSSWKDVQKAANKQTVNFYAWGGSDAINTYLDTSIAEELKKQGVTLNRVPVTDIKTIINKLLTEKIAKKEKGSIDLLWINGENFKFSKDNKLLWGAFAKNLPNVKKYIDLKTTQYDFGEPINSLESPWGTAQFVFVRNSNNAKISPSTYNDLTTILKNNPGKFTYPQSSDFIGSAFLRQIFNQVNPQGYEAVLAQNLSDEEVKTELLPVWKYLNSIKPYLWRNGETYPESSAKMHELYSRGEIIITMDYTPLLAESKVKDGSFPKSSRTFVFDRGSLFNNHYVAIPFNASNKAAAMILANILASPKAQGLKIDPKNWGDGTVLDITKLSSEDKKIFDSVELSEVSLTFEELGKRRIPELPAKYVDIIEEEWIKNVAKN